MPVNLDLEPIGSTTKTNIAVSPNWFPGLSHVEVVQQIAAYGFRAFSSDATPGKAQPADHEHG